MIVVVGFEDGAATVIAGFTLLNEADTFTALLHVETATQAAADLGDDVDV